MVRYLLVSLSEVETVRVHLLTKRKQSTRRSDRRRASRTTVDEPVALWFTRVGGGVGVAYGWTLNISSGGLRVIADAPLAVGDAVGVAIGRRDAPAVSGRVAWIDSRLDGAIAGIAFDTAPCRPLQETDNLRSSPSYS